MSGEMQANLTSDLQATESLAILFPNCNTRDTLAKAVPPSPPVSQEMVNYCVDKIGW